MKNNLKQLRKAAGFSLQQLGDMCGKSKVAIHHLEKDVANPTLKTAYGIALVLDISVTDIWPNNLKIITETITIRRIGD